MNSSKTELKVNKYDCLLAISRILDSSPNYSNSYSIKSPSHSSCPSSWWSNDPFLTRVNELGDSFNKGIIEHDTSSNISDSHNSHEQPKNQLPIHASRYSDFYKSHDEGNMITRNLEQLIIPQPSVPHRTT